MRKYTKQSYSSTIKDVSQALVKMSTEIIQNSKHAYFLHRTQKLEQKRSGMFQINFKD